DLKLQRRATMSLPWLQGILHGCEANLAARQQEAEEERQGQQRPLDEQIAPAGQGGPENPTPRGPPREGARAPPPPPPPRPPRPPGAGAHQGPGPELVSHPPREDGAAHE